MGTLPNEWTRSEADLEKLTTALSPCQFQRQTDENNLILLLIGDV